MPAISTSMTLHFFCAFQSHALLHPMTDAPLQDATYALLQEQLVSLGVATWSEAFPRDGENPGINFKTWNEDLRAILEDGGRVSLRIFMFCSDGGSEQVSFKQIVAVGMLAKVTDIFIHVLCNMHTGSLCSKGGLQRADEWLAQKWLQIPEALQRPRQVDVRVA